MEIYLDNAATTRPYEEVIDFQDRIMRECYGNPSSLHGKGFEAEKYIRYAQKTFADILKVEEKELLFTSGGTESNNMAIIGCAEAASRRGNHIVTTALEHPSVYNPVRFLENHGFTSDTVSSDEKGRLDLEALAAALTPDTVLVSIMGVNNEIGTVQPLADAVRIIREKCPEAVIHVDGIQTFAKIPVQPKKLGIDAFSVSGHKFHAPKGTGLLWVRDGIRMNPLLFGGGQQRDMRPGTQNVPGIAAMAKAAEIENADLPEKIQKMYALREYFIGEALKIEGVRLNGGLRAGDFTLSEDPEECAAPHVVSLGFEDIKSEVLLHALSDRGIYVSGGSACSSNHPNVSRTLKAISVPNEYIKSTLRFSFSYDTTQEELKTCIEALNEMLPVLRRYTEGGRKKRR
ncbi:MAG: cysteine desulfurase [Lachnospiraceae bacterium]|nr:cysteine desulfurase [Lachnospiraceae bacterium]